MLLSEIQSIAYMSTLCLFRSVSRYAILHCSASAKLASAFATFATLALSTVLQISTVLHYSVYFLGTLAHLVVCTVLEMVIIAFHA